MNLPLLLKRLAMTQMGIAQHLANPKFHDPDGRTALLEESKRIVADLQRFIDTHRIETTKREPGIVKKRECGEWH